jgi:NAD(P)-dependent dehydrogenase (short-subunit alcohol dehydrogenase family)
MKLIDRADYPYAVVKREQPIGWLGDSDEIAQAVIWLCNPGAKCPCRILSAYLPMCPQTF